MLALSAISATRNLFAAAKLARRGKSRKPDVEAWGLRRESELLRIQRELNDGEWTPTGYRQFWIHEPKRRLISAAPFADRVVHHALCRKLNPLLEAHFHPRSFSCRVGLGTTAARDHVRRLTNASRFVLKCDVRKFFDSISHALLLQKLLSTVPMEKGVAVVVERIIRSMESAPGRGLPIGNLTSQWWGNFYLSGMDHRLAALPGIQGYARYTDDFLLFADKKATLHQALRVVREELSALELNLALPKSRLLACREGVPFCGFRFLPGRQPRILGATVRRFRKRQHCLLKKGDVKKATQSTFAWYQFAKEGNTLGLKKAWSRFRPKG